MSTKKELLDSVKNAFTPGKHDALLENCKDTITETYSVFNKTKKLFKLLGDIIKYMILSVDDPEYQKIKDQQIVMPNNEDKLICVLGVYYKAFSHEINEIFYEIVNHPKFADLYAIAEIPSTLVSAVVDETIDADGLTRDYAEFSAITKVLTIEALKLGIDFSSPIIDNIDDKQDAQKNIDDKQDAQKNIDAE